MAPPGYPNDAMGDTLALLNRRRVLHPNRAPLLGSVGKLWGKAVLLAMAGKQFRYEYSKAFQ